MAVEAAILVLSDMHFGRDLLEGPETTQFRMSSLVRLAAKVPGVQRYIDEGCRGHSYSCVTELPLYLKKVLRDLRDDGYYPDEEAYDLVILLGDQVTVPDHSSYRFIRDYLTKTSFRTKGIECDGLAIDPARLLSIPGNHDKLLLPDLELYKREFSSRLALPSIGPQKCRVHSRMLGGHEILFVLVEASIYSQTGIIDLHCGEHLACGNISAGLEKSIVQKLDRLKRGIPADGVRLKQPYEDVTKIMLVHYAVDLSKFKRNAGLRARFFHAAANLAVPHNCEGLPELVAKLGKEYQLSSVLHGHLHEKVIYPHCGVTVVASTTVTQDSHNNGFFILKVLDTGELVAEHHVWDGAQFVPDTHEKVLDLAA